MAQHSSNTEPLRDMLVAYEIEVVKTRTGATRYHRDWYPRDDWLAGKDLMERDVGSPERSISF